MFCNRAASWPLHSTTSTFSLLLLKSMMVSFIRR
uniref:Uncharacterized protein n=1 Tax=Arundo donax TaxID=35708 RepID=A0A0A9FBY3_ARUDO